ncbi:hypothetical protein MTBLM1_20007 [Rhodospirillaceae bacterium LM-1]|nr:hypothetical protein MTBLM1_20007 [Rhodospirillaceae bacterium LM-1]
MLPLLLAACGGGTVYAPFQAVDDLDSYLRYAAPEGEAQVEIVGNPFSSSPQALAQGLVQGFAGGVAYGPDLRFSTNSRSARTGYRFVVAFAAPVTATGDDLCRDAANLALSPRAQPVRVKAAFCIQNRAYSEAAGQLGEISDPFSAPFRLWARNLMRALTPTPVLDVQSD